MAAAARTPRRRASQGIALRGIRWDRLGRIALLSVLGVILLLYISPARHWIEQSRTAASMRAELRELEADNARLRSRARELRDPAALEREARRLGMVRQGERSYVIQR